MHAADHKICDIDNTDLFLKEFVSAAMYMACLLHYDSSYVANDEIILEANEASYIPHNVRIAMIIVHVN